MQDRKTRPTDHPAYDDMTMVFGPAQADEWRRTFPDPLPPDREYHIRWEGNHLIAGTREKPAVDVLGRPAKGDGKPARVAGPAAAKELTAKFNAMKDADLHTEAGELGVEVKGVKKHELIAAMVKAEQERQAQADKGDGQGE